ncbi:MULTISPECIES: DUF4331 family protein [unclassified Nonomuraea]|uniref:DUF4331 family protein n=1 Tax=unclassified Nonomuraea TaxID=2593643 RepID=UPI0035C07D64
MSHHLDSPLARQDPRLDITDQYVFRGETGTVFVMNVSHSLAGNVTRGFHPEARYEFKIDGNGDAVEDVTYRFTFGDRDADGEQAFELRRITGPAARDLFGSGPVVARGTTGTTVDGGQGLRVWAGMAGDPFWIEPDVLHAVGAAFEHGTKVDLSGWDPATAVNLFAGHTVYSIVLELPHGELRPVCGDDGRIGVWSLTTLATDAGGWRPVNRAGLPMIHPLFTQLDEHLGDHLNEGHPSEDRQVHGKAIADKVTGVVRAYGTAEDPAAYGRAVAAKVFPNVLPYTLDTSASFGFAGWNGRSLTDNAPDVMFSFAANTPVALGITKESVTAAPRRTFPYVPSAR